MGKTVDSLGQGTRPDPVRSFNRWKKKHSHRQNQKKERRKQLKKPEWQVEREGISRLMQNYEKVRRAQGSAGGRSGRGHGRCCCGKGADPAREVVCWVSLPRSGSSACHSSGKSDRNAAILRIGGSSGDSCVKNMAGGVRAENVCCSVECWPDVEEAICSVSSST